MNSFKHPVKGVIHIADMTPNQLLQTYLMASHLYYQRYESIMDDSCFDAICKRMVECYEDIEHDHKYLVTKDDLVAGTGYTIRDYPMVVKMAADMWMREDL